MSQYSSQSVGVSLVSTFAPDKVDLPKDVMSDLLETWHLTAFSLLHLMYRPMEASLINGLQRAVAEVANHIRKFPIRCTNVMVFRGTHPSFGIEVERTSDLLSFEQDLIKSISEYNDELRYYQYPGQKISMLEAISDRVRDQEISEAIANTSNVSFNQVIYLDNIVLISRNFTEKTVSTEVITLAP